MPEFVLTSSIRVIKLNAMDEKYCLHGIDFEWNEEKANINLQKHHISFSKACELFFDPFVMPFDDEIIDGEVRFTALGMTVDWQILCVVYIWRGDVIRLISARLATIHERKRYESGTT
jgi:uncharacterized DUF497 family protein